MPLHLGPINRRQFLARAALAGATLSPVLQLLAREKQEDPAVWALFSDIHVAADRSFKVRGVNMVSHFEKARADLLGLERRPAGFFINGDCAYNSGLPADYQVVK